jgi:beta-glucosidase
LISTWPDPLGLGAIGDPDVVRQFGRIAAREYRALGLHVTLAPMADVATEPRWNRINGTFGDDAALNARMVKAFVEGFQGRELGPESVMCVTKHWPGDGPVKDGLDPHNDYGKWQVYPGGKFDYHLGPFQAAIEAGTGGMMGAYAIPVGFDTVGVNFSKRMITDLLRKKYHFDGYIVTDWNRSMPWGVENLSQKERERMMIEAGVDQLGGEHDPSLLMELIEAGQISQARIDESVARILRPMFQLGLFENPYLDPERSRTIVASKEFVNAGETAQRRSVVLLKNTGGTLPVQGEPRIYLEGFGKSAADPYGTAAEDVRSADVAVIKVNAPFAFHPGGGGFFARVHEGTLAYAGAENVSELEAIERLAASGKPVVVCMYMDRPAVLSEFIERVPAVLAHFGSSDSALLDVVFGRFRPSGKLPFDLPRDMKSVEKQMPDVAHDLENPLFRFGYGLTY